MTIDLNEAATAAVVKLIESKAIEQTIEKALAKTVTDLVASALSEYSGFGNQLKAAVAKSLAIQGDIDLPSYNHTILKIIERQVESSTQKSIEREVASRMKELLTPAPESIKLSKLVEQYVESLRKENDDGCTCYGEEKAFAKLEDGSYRFKTLTLAKAEKPDGYSRRRDGEISIGITEKGEVYHLSFQDQEVEKRMFAGPFYGFERSIFQMRAAKTVIEIDCDPSDLSLHYGRNVD